MPIRITHIPAPPRFLTLACACVLLGGCGNDLLAPRQQLSAAGMAAARAAAGVTLSAYTASTSAISISWNDNARNETGWEIHRSTTGAAGPFALLQAVAANTTGYQNSGLTQLTEYCYRVRSYRTSGPNTSFGAFSNTGCATTFGPPAAPSDLTASPTGSSWVRVTWTDNSSDETAFRLERSADPAGPWSTAASLAANVTSFTVQQLAEQLACYRVVAVGIHDVAASGSDCTAPPASPSNVTAAASGARITVSWTDNSSVEDGYRVARAGSDQVFTTIAMLAANATTYEDASAAPDTPYWYEVRAMKDGGTSDHVVSGVAFIVSAPPAAPTIAASPGGSTAAWVIVSDVSVTTSNFRFERSPDGVSGWEAAGTVPAADGGFFDAGRATEQRVCYRAYASNAIGESSASGVDCTIPLAAPTGLHLVPGADGTTTLAWTDNSANEESYYIVVMYCWPEGGCDWYYDAYLPANSTSTVLGANEYVYSLTAYGDGGYSDEGTWGTGALTAIKSSAALRTLAAPAAPGRLGERRKALHERPSAIRRQR